MSKNKINKKSLTAKRDFELLCNDDHFVIKKGDDLINMGVPEKYLQNLKTEKVI